ncbi:cytochrome c3 family protein [Carboxydothermus hydrogenoformans]|uniref:Putative cytochrome c n=1 Tax=Carboxydothermus hydrogenoformans (strain ATCC BAA-161 / DSM 6008 / Z-2901) TaxID=246194 RepID=Q3AFH9_CARHZ|nr:cytochrome c3 family protein [Carboxydothermus hydrogenoformans]ABB14483.1 putative cytochrome c [Carboxydothermus hydrogenoformans Z-2901]
MRRKSLVILLLAVFVLLFSGTTLAADHSQGKDCLSCHQKYDHSRLQKYEGSKNCLPCHSDQVNDVIHSDHYTWQSKPVNLIDAAGKPWPADKPVGKLGGLNDFCITPDINFLGILVNKNGANVKGGCGQCHVGMGSRPDKIDEAKDKENVDCLICHADYSVYNRNLKTIVQDAYGNLYYIPNTSVIDIAYVKKANVSGTVDITAALKSIKKTPDNKNCLQCHAFAGGGPNNKRGDLEPILMTEPAKVDVHMGSGMKCVDCHKTENHKIAGRGVDLRTNELNYNVRCENCHSTKVHKGPLGVALNNHVKSIDCTTCHVPEYAITQSTDVFRDWSQAEYNSVTALYEPKIERGQNLKPVYLWWNGLSYAQQTDVPAVFNKDNKYAPNKTTKPDYVTLFAPVGSINDPKAKIYPFRYHYAYMPIDPVTGKFFPAKAGYVFMTGDVLGGFTKGYKEWFGVDLVSPVKWVYAERYMGLYHEVKPASQALSCTSCHSNRGVLNWKALGYKGDPIIYGARKVVTTPAVKTYTVTKTTYLYQTASTKAKKLTTLKAGTKVTYVSASGNYYKVQVKVGSKTYTGYVLKSYLK